MREMSRDARRGPRRLRLVPSADTGDLNGDAEGVAGIILPGRRHSVAVGRHWVVDTAANHGVTGMANQVVELLSSELLANAVLHGPEGGAVAVHVAVKTDRVRVTVSDNGAGRGGPVVLHRDPDALTGRGMAIVDALASRWGADGDGTGTAVWFEVDLDDL